MLVYTHFRKSGVSTRNAKSTLRLLPNGADRTRMARVWRVFANFPRCNPRKSTKPEKSAFYLVSSVLLPSAHNRGSVCAQNCWMVRFTSTAPLTLFLSVFFRKIPMLAEQEFGEFIPL